MALALALVLIGWALVRPVNGLCELRVGSCWRRCWAICAIDLMSPAPFCQSGSAAHALFDTGVVATRICFGRNSAVMVAALTVSIGGAQRGRADLDNHRPRRCRALFGQARGAKPGGAGGLSHRGTRMKAFEYKHFLIVGPRTRPGRQNAAKCG